MNIITKINDYFLKNCIEDRNDNFYDYCEFEEDTNSILFYSDCILTGIFHCDDYSFEDLSTSFTDYVNLGIILSKNSMFKGDKNGFIY